MIYNKILSIIIYHVNHVPWSPRGATRRGAWTDACLSCGKTSRNRLRPARWARRAVGRRRRGKGRRRSRGTWERFDYIGDRVDYREGGGKGEGTGEGKGRERERGTHIERVSSEKEETVYGVWTRTSKNCVYPSPLTHINLLISTHKSI